MVTELKRARTICLTWQPENGVVGKGRPRVLKSGRTYTPLKTKEAAAEVVVEWLGLGINHEWCKGYAGPVSMSIEYQRQLPKSAPANRSGEYDLSKPDVDNVAKLIMDALNGYAYKDDSQITNLSIRKLPRGDHGELDIINVVIRYG